MSQSPSYLRDSASASPESPEEGDFSPRQLRDNPESPEEHETCEDQIDPIVNITPDDCSGSLLNTRICAPPATNDLGKLCAGALPQEQQIKRSRWREPRCIGTSPIRNELAASAEFTEVRALDGRFITLASAQTQTDWEWVEQSLSLSCQVQKETEDPRLLQAEAEPEDEKEDYDIPCVGLPRLIAYRPEPKRTPRVQKVPGVGSKQDVHLARCDYCQQPSRPFVLSAPPENETDFLFCCERAKQTREFLLVERGRLAWEESVRETDVTSPAPVTSEETREAAKKRARLRRLQLQRKSKKGNLSKNASCTESSGKASYRLSEKIPHISDEPNILQIDIKNTTGMFALQAEADGKPKPKEVMQKFYKGGKCFLTLCPDGTGNVFYPSGKAAIIISSTEAADFTYVILEDKDTEPGIKGIFTNKGHSTCYHPNGAIWLSLTPAGGLCLSETGALRRRWNWLYFDPHARALPFKPLTFALGPHVGVRVHSQEHVYLTFAHRRNSVRFSVGSRLKLMHPESRDKPGPDVVERYIQRKSAEIYSLLGQMQTCMSHPNCFITQTQQLSRQMEKEKSPTKEIKTHVN